MAMVSIGGIIGLTCFLFFILVPIGLLVAVQVWLCKKSLRLGLILPGLSLALSLLLALTVGASLMLTRGGGTVTVRDETTGEIVRQENFESNVYTNPTALAGAGVLFLVANIPTAVFGGIWLHCKGRRDTLEDLKKMRIEDLG